ncbi:DNA polymerase beta superfamily protein, partial [Streptomyces sp. NPDC017890]
MTEIAHSEPKFKAIADSNTVLRGQVGSGLHGVTTGNDDRDEMGVCIEPPEFVIGVSKFEQYQYRTQPEGVRSGAGDLDLVVYSLRKWARLAEAGNPTVLLLMFIPPHELVLNTY